MKIIAMNLKKGFVKVVPEAFDDLWHLYNIVYKDDEVHTRTTREIKPDERYARPKRGQRIPVLLGVKVEKTGWDKLLGRLRVHGTICRAPETVPMGSHHTLNVTLNKPLTVVKKKWPRHHVERLKKASRTSEKPVTVIAIDDDGYAIATTRQYGVEVKVEERVKLPGKLEADKRSSAVKRYFKKASESLAQVSTSTDSPIAIIGVGFFKNSFAKFLQEEARDVARSVVDVKGVNNGGVAGVYEALRSGVLSKAMKHLRIVEETRLVEEALRRLGKGKQDIAYGRETVERAAQAGAVETLILADTALRKASDEERLALEGLMKTVEQKGGEVMIVSTEHEAGTKTVGLGGVVALLRYALY